MERITLGGGCFWCVEAVFRLLEGVEGVIPGYAGGWKPSPTYEEVCSGTTGHAEVVRVTFDPERLPLGVLLDVFFAIHDPTSRNRQGPDVGPQYRSIILYEAVRQIPVIRAKLRELEARLDRPVVTEVFPLDRFWPAEPEHRRYYERNPLAPYCVGVITPKIQQVMRRFPDRIR